MIISRTPPLKSCLSFDIEEHFQVSAFESPMRRRHWDLYESRVENNTQRLIELLERHSVKATFFVLGWVAERYPSLVKEIASAGHEVASHGYGHELITNQTPLAFREDVRKAKLILEDLISAPIGGFRAPSFSITRETRWALSILVEEGYVYDSSIFPVVHDRYGIPSASPNIRPLNTESGTILEVPPSVVSIFGINLPVAGGGYFRLYPYFLLRRLLRRVLSNNLPLVMYLHPWELDPDQPRMEGPALSKFRHYLNLRRCESRLNRLLRDFSFAPINEVIDSLKKSFESPSNDVLALRSCLRNQSLA